MPILPRKRIIGPIPITDLIIGASLIYSKKYGIHCVGTYWQEGYKARGYAPPDQIGLGPLCATLGYTKQTPGAGPSTHRRNIQ